MQYASDNNNFSMTPFSVSLVPSVTYTELFGLFLTHWHSQPSNQRLHTDFDSFACYKEILKGGMMCFILQRTRKKARQNHLTNK